MTQLDQPKLVGGQVTNGHVATTLSPKKVTSTRSPSQKGHKNCHPDLRGPQRPPDHPSHEGCVPSRTARPLERPLGNFLRTLGISGWDFGTASSWKRMASSVLFLPFFD